MVDRIESCRKVEQTEQSVVARVNRLSEVGNHLQQRGLGRMKPSIGRLVDWQKTRRRQVLGQLDAGYTFKKL